MCDGNKCFLVHLTDSGGRDITRVFEGGRRVRAVCVSRISARVCGSAHVGRAHDVVVECYTSFERFFFNTKIVTYEGPLCNPHA